MIDFLNGSSVKYVLTTSPIIYTLCIKQFWTSAKVKTVNNEVRIQALVDGKRVNIKESSIRHTLRLDDVEGTSCLSNIEIFEGLAKIGYEKPSDKLTFYKAFFSSQWKFLIHTILQCLSGKTTSWNKFSITMASAIICLATNQKFNFSRYKSEDLSTIEMPMSEPLLEYACMFTKHVQELFVYVSKTWLNLMKPCEKLVDVTPMNKDKKVRFVEPITSSSNILKQTDSLRTKDSNKPFLTSTGVNTTTSASESNPSCSTKKKRI
nr:hypothetical protein [Tanacetum cinerariifolium]